jgi:hypothetical protein
VSAQTSTKRADMPSLWPSGQCPLWVKSRHMQCKTACPLYPRKRTCAVQLTMSALGQKRTYDLFDHLVGAAEKRHRDCEAERLGGLEVQDQFDLGRLLHWQVGRLFALENPARVNAG